MRLQREGVHNINLVTPSHYRPWIIEGLDEARRRGLMLPVVWNTGGYESEAAIAELRAQVDVWLFDLKFCSPALSARLADAPDYFEVALRAARAACALAGPPVFGPDGTLKRGFILRVLVLPGQRQDAKNLLRRAAAALPRDGFLLSLMSQYTPPERDGVPKDLGRRLSSFEYNDVADFAQALGITRGYFQQRDSADGHYLPDFEHGGERDL